jgi:hypothetical protein
VPSDDLARVEELLAQLDSASTKIERRLKTIALGRDPALPGCARELLSSSRDELRRAGVAIFHGLASPGTEPAVQVEPSIVAAVVELEALSDAERLEVLHRFAVAGSDVSAAEAWLRERSEERDASEVLLHIAARRGDFDVLSEATMAPAVFDRVIANAIACHAKDDALLAFLSRLDATVLDVAGALFGVHAARGEPDAAVRAILDKGTPKRVRSHAIRLEQGGAQAFVEALEEHAHEYPEAAARLLSELVSRRPIQQMLSLQPMRALVDDPDASPLVWPALLRLSRLRDEPLGLPVERVLAAMDGADADLQASLLSALAAHEGPMPKPFAARVAEAMKSKKASVREMAVWAGCSHAAALGREDVTALAARVGDRSASVRAQLARGLVSVAEAGHDISATHDALREWCAVSPKKTRKEDARNAAIGASVVLGRATTEPSPDEIRVWWNAGLRHEDPTLAEWCCDLICDEIARDDAYRDEVAQSVPRGDDPIFAKLRAALGS